MQFEGISAIFCNRDHNVLKSSTGIDRRTIDVDIWLVLLY